jgi:hypothetical protein
MSSSSATHTKSTHVTKSHASKANVAEAAATPPTSSGVEPVAVAALPHVSTTPPAPAPTAPPLQSRVTGAIALVNQAMVMLALVAPPLSPAQVKAATKFRKGGEAQIPALAEMSGVYGVEVPSRPTADMEVNVATAQTLAPLVTLITRFLTLVESASFQVRSEAWATASTLYQMLRKASVRQPALKADLAPLEEFFSYRHPLVKETAAVSAAKEAKQAKRQANAAKKLQRLQSAVTKAGAAVVLSDAPPAPAAASEVASAPPPTGPTPSHS